MCHCWFICVIKSGKTLCLISFYLFDADTRTLLSGLKTYNCWGYSFSLCCFVFVFVSIFIRCFIICTILFFIITSSEVLFLLFRSVFVCLYVSLCVSFTEF